MTRRIIIGSAVALAGCLLLGAAPPEADFEAVYRRNFADLMRDNGAPSVYAPLEAIHGAKAQRPIPQARPSVLKADALAAATAYAAANNSTALLVWRDGKMELERYFGATTAATPLVAKSLSKPLGAIAVGRAIRLGRIRSLDQPAADFLTEWRGTPKQAITIRHLLAMRAGLLEQGFSTDPASPLNRAFVHPDHGRELIEGYPLVAEPGSTFKYSNASAELIAPLIERATGMRYAQFLGREVLAPIGAVGGDIWVDRVGGLAHSGCCMHLPAQSWLRLAVLLHDDGKVGGRRLLPAGYVREMTTASAQNPWHGLGVWIAGPFTKRRGFSGIAGSGPQVLHAEPYLDRNLFLFDGNANQVAYVSRAARLVILRLGDAPPRSPEWDNSKLPNMLIRGLRTGVPPDLVPQL